MKPLFPVLLLSPLVLSCDPPPTEPMSPATGLVGTWLMEATYLGPGDGSGDYEDVTDGMLITFAEDGAFSTSGGTICGSAPTGSHTGTYHPGGTLSGDDCVTSSFLPTWELAERKLFITFLRAEPRIGRFVRLN